MRITPQRLIEALLAVRAETGGYLNDKIDDLIKDIEAEYEENKNFTIIEFE